MRMPSFPEMPLSRRCAFALSQLTSPGATASPIDHRHAADPEQPTVDTVYRSRIYPRKSIVPWLADSMVV